MVLATRTTPFTHQAIQRTENNLNDVTDFIASNELGSNRFNSDYTPDPDPPILTIATGINSSITTNEVWLTLNIGEWLLLDFGYVWTILSDEEFTANYSTS